MQSYIDLAAKNGVELHDEGNCQFCGAHAQRGIHECLEVFNLGFKQIDFNLPENHIYRFFIVDAHTLQHSEIHGRWNNHFHLSRLHLIFKYQIHWTYQLSPKLSTHLKLYKQRHPDEHLAPPNVLERGKITSSDISALSDSCQASELKSQIKNWASEVYSIWSLHHATVDQIAQNLKFQ